VPTVSRVRQARKCRARRTDGQPCGNYAIIGGTVCRVHGGAAIQVRRKADERVLMARAYRIMITLSHSPTEREHQEMCERAFPERTEAPFRSALAAWLEGETE